MYLGMSADVCFSLAATSVELDVLSDVLATTGAAFPQALSVGKYVTQMPADKVYTIREKFCRKVGISTRDCIIFSPPLFFSTILKN